jgi:RNA polymerase sigma-70 factor (ECF subfamily)
MANAEAGDVGKGGRTTPLSLLERARARDEVAWYRLMALYRPLVLYWCARKRVAAADCEDVTQEVFAATARALAHFRRDRPGDTFRGWLRAVTSNQILLYFRRRQGQPLAEGGSEALQRLQDLPDPLTDPVPGEEAEMSRLYQQALEQVRCEFEDSSWRAFWLTAIENREPASVVGELGMTTAAIRQAKSRILRRIKQELGDILL